MKLDTKALTAIREYLDETMYTLVDFRLSFEVPRGPTGFPDFQRLQQTVKRLDPMHQVLFRLFRLGEAVDDASVRSALPDRILSTMVNIDLIDRDEASAWRTPNLLIVPAEGILVMVGVPPSYPTALKPCAVWFDLSSYVVARALPRCFAGERVLDICSGSGIQSLLCAARGAEQVVGLELSEEAVLTARANAILNGLAGKVDFRRSDMLVALGNEEAFDFIICNTPYAPVTVGMNVPSSLEVLGSGVLLELLDELPRHLSGRGRGILGTWRAAGYQSSTYQMQYVASRLKRDGFSAVAFSDRAPDTVQGVLRILETDLERRTSVDRAEAILNAARVLLEHSDRPVDGFYNQLIYFRKGCIEAVSEHRATFGLSVSTQAAEA